MRSITRALPTPPPGVPITALPCRIVTATPLVVDFYSTPQFPGTRVLGLTYANGAPALAVMLPGATPVIYPIGA